MTKQRGRVIAALLLCMLLSMATVLSLCPAAAVADDGSSNTTVAGSFTVRLVISNASASNIGEFSATIHWTTNGNATSQVFYDTQPHSIIDDYAHSTPTDTVHVSTHTIQITGLSPSTTYRYRVNSVAQAGALTATSEDYTFTTSSTPDEPSKPPSSEPKKPATEPTGIEVPIGQGTANATDSAGNALPVTSGVIIISDNPATTGLSVNIPVTLGTGNQLKSFTDSRGTTFSNNTLVIPTGSAAPDSGMRFTIYDDNLGDLSTIVTLHTGDAMGNGSYAVAPVNSIEGAHSAFANKDFTAQAPSIGEVASALDIQLNTLPQNSAVKIDTSLEPDPAASSAFQLAAASVGMAAFETAYSINVTKINIENGKDIKSATITMKISADWVATHGGLDVITILRYDPETDQKQALQTSFKGYDNEGRAIFQGFSPNGLSVFALVGLPDNVPPFVLSFFPKDGNKINANGAAISVTFNEEIDKASAEKGFSISPNVRGTFRWGGNTTLIFTPDSSLDFDTIYTIVISTAANDLAGNPLEEQIIWRFKVVATPDIIPPNILSASLTDGATGVRVDAEISITFDEPMNKASVQNAFIISPAIDGKFRWKDNTLIFVPNHILDFNTEYSVNVANTAQDLSGNPLAMEFRLAFTTMLRPTMPPTVINTSLADGSTGVAAKSVFSITFSQPMDRDSVEKAFSISPAISGKFTWENDIMTFIFTPDTELGSGTRYTVAISNTAKDVAGNNLTPYAWSFTIATPPATMPLVFGLVAVGLAALATSFFLIAAWRRGRKHEEEPVAVSVQPTATTVDDNGEFVKADLEEYLGGSASNKTTL